MTVLCMLITTAAAHAGSGALFLSLEISGCVARMGVFVNLCVHMYVHVQLAGCLLLSAAACMPEYSQCL